MLVIIFVVTSYSFIVLKYCRTFTTFEELVSDYAAGELHPGDLKPALSKALNKILEVCHFCTIFFHEYLLLLELVVVIFLLYYSTKHYYGFCANNLIRSS